jgi:hypothetical protein
MTDDELVALEIRRPLATFLSAIPIWRSLPAARLAGSGTLAFRMRV